VSAHAPTGRDAATLPAGVHSPLQHKYLSPLRVLPLSPQVFRNRGTLPTRTRQGWVKMAYVKEASSIVVLQDAVGAAPQQHTTTTIVRMGSIAMERVIGHLPRDILHTRLHPIYVDGVAHARLRRTQTARRRSSWERFRTLR
jgi:hypothetical protein